MFVCGGVWEGVGVGDGVFVCDHLVSFSGFSVREGVWGLMGLGVWV